MSRSQTKMGSALDKESARTGRQYHLEKHTPTAYTPNTSLNGVFSRRAMLGKSKKLER